MTWGRSHERRDTLFVSVVLVLSYLTLLLFVARISPVGRALTPLPTPPLRSSLVLCEC